MDHTGCPPDDDNVRQRVRYYFGQLLDVDDFVQEQAYHLAKSRRHNRSLHGWGIVAGLEVSAVGSGRRQVSVGPGFALDPCGNEISVSDPVVVDVPDDGPTFLVLRFEETVVQEERVRDGFEIALVPDLHGPCVALAAISTGEADGLFIDDSVRRPLAVDGPANTPSP